MVEQIHILVNQLPGNGVHSITKAHSEHHPSLWVRQESYLARHVPVTSIAILILDALVFIFFATKMEHLAGIQIVAALYPASGKVSSKDFTVPGRYFTHEPLDQSELLRISLLAWLPRPWTLRNRF